MLKSKKFETKEQYVTEEISSNLFVNYGNKMEARVDVSDTPRRRYYGNLRKDVHVLEDYPDSNYAKAKELKFNDKSILLLEWFFDSVDDKYFETQYEIRSGISLYMKRALRNEVTGYVYKITENFSEYLVDYNSRPNIEPLGQFTLPENTYGWFDIDLGNYLDEYDKEEGGFSEKLAIVIDTNNTTFTYARESGMTDLVPELWYEYYYVPPNSAMRIVDSNINIEDSSSDLFNSVVEVDSNYALDKSPVIFNIEKLEDSDSFPVTSFIMAQGSPKPTFKTILDIEKFDDKDSASFITDILRTNDKGLSSNIDIPKFDKETNIDANTTVYYEKEKNFNTIFDIDQIFRQPKLPGNIRVNYIKDESMKSNIYVPEFVDNKEYLNSEISVRYDNDKTINSILSIDRFDTEDELNSELSIAYEPTEIISSIIKIDKISDMGTFNSNIFILELNKKNLTTNIDIPSFDGDLEFPANTRVYDIKTSKLSSRITLEKIIEKPKINTKIEVMQQDTAELSSEIFIKPEERKAYNFIM